jgi:O-antigen chain-terminating methyltransferase
VPADQALPPGSDPALEPIARLLFETINPESVYAMKWFWMDLTHVRPVPAPSLAQLLTASGFRDVTVDFRSPVPADQALPPGSDPALEPIARLLFAPQDYAVTGLR